jgi:hypothetical protein
MRGEVRLDCAATAGSGYLASSEAHAMRSSKAPAE